MKLLNKLICAFKGHQPYCRVDPIPRITEKDFKTSHPQKISLSNMATISPLSITGTILSNSNWANTTIAHNSGLSIMNYGGAIINNLHVCRRCDAIFVKTEANHQIVGDIKNYPVLKEHIDWIKQMEWEKKLHEENKAVKEAWNNYQLLIKLSKRTDSDK
jgi:hypothetical protein